MNHPSKFSPLILLVTLAILSLTYCAPIKPSDQSSLTSSRQRKSLGYYDYLQPDFGTTGGLPGAYQPLINSPIITDDYDTFDYDNAYVHDDLNDANDDDDEDDENDTSNDLSSRALPKRKRVRTRPGATAQNRQQQRPVAYNSPIYYIRLPPQPYMFVPGLGYVSQPPSNPAAQFLNLPVSFVANGKPANIYQWSSPSGGSPLQGFGDEQQQHQQQQHQQQHPTVSPIVTRPKPQQKPDSTIHRLPGQYTFNGKPDDIFVLRDSYNSLYSDALQNFYP